MYCRTIYLPYSSTLAGIKGPNVTVKVDPDEIEN
jgi:hypothetical protein